METTTIEPMAETETVKFDLTFLQTRAPRSPEEMAEWEWKNEVLPRLKACGFDKRYWTRQPWTCAPQRKTFEKCMELCVGVGAIVVLTGKRGTGKTTIAAQIAIARAMDASLPPWERQPPYRKLSDVIARFKPLYADFGSTQTDALMESRDNSCRGTRLAFFDEIHECDDQKLKDRILSDILDRRYAARNDTILISNQTPEEFTKTTSDSILSRIREHGATVACNWKSFRE